MLHNVKWYQVLLAVAVLVLFLSMALMAGQNSINSREEKSIEAVTNESSYYPTALPNQRCYNPLGFVLVDNSKPVDEQCTKVYSWSELEVELKTLGLETSFRGEKYSVVNGDSYYFAVQAHQDYEAVDTTERINEVIQSHDYQGSGTVVVIFNLNSVYSLQVFTYFDGEKVPPQLGIPE